MRYVRALLVATVLAAFLTTVVGIVIPDVCKSIPLDDWFLRLMLGCSDKDTAGGGGGGAG